MKNIRRIKFFIISMLILMLSLSCNEIKEQEKKTEIPGTCGLPKIDYDYNPKAAGAEIVQRIDAPAGLFVTRTNGHYYMITADKITVFDIQNNKMQIIREIPYQLEQLCPNVDKNFLHGSSIFQINNKMYFGLYTDMRGLRYDSDRKQVISFALADDSPRFKGILSLNDDGTQLCYADITSDLMEPQKIERMYYYESTKELLVNQYTYSKILVRYHYNSNTGHFEKQDETDIRDYGFKWDNSVYFFTDRYSFANRYDFHFNYILVTNYLDILLHGETEIHKTIALFKLGIHYPLLSAFSDDDGDIWLYVREYDSETQQDKYELLKLKLLE